MRVRCAAVSFRILDGQLGQQRLCERIVVGGGHEPEL
jgi:hypothetical protein